MAYEKSKSKSVSLFPSLWEKVEAKAALQHGRNRSDYIRELIEADLRNDETGDTEALVNIAYDHCNSWVRGRLMDILKHHEIDQRELLARLLEETTQALESLNEGEDWRKIWVAKPSYERVMLAAEDPPKKKKPKPNGDLPHAS